MDYVGDFNSTVESIFVKPVQAMGDSIIHDVNTVLYSNNLTEKVMASSSLLLDAAMVFGVPESLAINVGSKISGALSKASFWKSAEAIESFGNFGANNHINALRLQQQLKIDQASSIFTETGKLRPEIIDKSDVIIPGQDLSNPKLIQELTRLGGDISDWGKYATKSIPSPSGNFQMHFYHNSLTSEVYYGMDYKAIFDHQGAWNVKPQPNFGYETSRFNK